ncbi:dihydrolipoyl dehydrogenase [Leuconostoc carnosum]|uniref:dihydrolipoyl dehydrogenase n=1 Tax=Leuconostoc TaxID=1243 RepID=UPI000D517362|nr:MULTISPECIES: dihydrolipoyl dehydrogenase [Leuconostoc]KAA8325624.1 dihydrolipoyl dehydrogenase [Leuconostoc carnosum]KAA8359845.1 dihydrolipoyl dehydrogenase [Leuconostoc carnosum]KAA8365421.1 dihydrolipoyl dehydrogenase [Leuconostoc carnosum]KAA8367790.1 dihydrolipoyl dehydrogenase [Leuconostoc carnosum]KAA8372983.1 dihydrolipoyl dehydrogenase [Leuconostoc carnosum]
MVVGAQARDIDTVIIGSGPGGYVAAIRAAELGQKVTLVERDNIGGVCLNIGCIPSKALINVGHHYREAISDTPFGLKTTETSLDWSKTQDWKQNTVVHALTSGVEMLLKKHQVEIIKGEATFNDNETINVVQEDGHELFQFNNAIIATGSRPIEIPGFVFSGRIIDSTGALSLQEIPKKLIIVGGGVIGSELGGVYANLGTQVTIVEGLDHTLNGFDKEMTKPVLDDFKKQGGEIITSATAKSAVQTDDSVTLTYEVAGESQTVTGDYLLVAVGRHANTDNLGLNNTDVKLTDHGLIEIANNMQTSVPHIYAVGDITAGPQLAHKASFQGKIAAAAISGDKQARDLHYSLPAVAYTHFELATTGETPETAKAANLDVNIAKFPFAANGRAISMNDTVGFIRLISDKSTRALLGAQIVGPSASDLISELSLAIENGLTTTDISLTIHPHPTLGEAIMDTAELADGLPIHI